MDQLESQMGLAVPLWLDILILKYQSFVHKLTSTDTGVSSAGSGGAVKSLLPVTKGKLACLVAVCLFGTIPCTTSERESIVEVFVF
jgi:hypothetical protein